MYELTLNGPGKNSLGTSMMQLIVDELHRAGGEPVLLSGAGDALSAGLDLKEVASLDHDAMIAFLRLLDRMVSALYLYPGPTVALVNGHAIAGGCVLALACDFRVVAASPKIKLGLNEIALGVRFPPRTLAMVKRRVPPRHLEEVVLGAGLVDPEGALRLGLVDQVSGDAPKAARAKLDALAAHPREAFALAKRDLRGTEDDLFPREAEDARLREVSAIWTSQAVKDKLGAVLKR